MEVLGYVTQAFELGEEEPAYHTALLFLTESLSLPEFSYDLITSHAGVAAWHHR